VVDFTNLDLGEIETNSAVWFVLKARFSCLRIETVEN